MHSLNESYVFYVLKYKEENVCYMLKNILTNKAYRLIISDKNYYNCKDKIDSNREDGGYELESNKINNNSYNDFYKHDIPDEQLDLDKIDLGIDIDTNNSNNNNKDGKNYENDKNNLTNDKILNQLLSFKSESKISLKDATKVMLLELDIKENYNNIQSNTSNTASNKTQVLFFINSLGVNSFYVIKKNNKNKRVLNLELLKIFSVTDDTVFITKFSYSNLESLYSNINNNRVIVIENELTYINFYSFNFFYDRVNNSDTKCLHIKSNHYSLPNNHFVFHNNFIKKDSMNRFFKLALSIKSNTTNNSNTYDIYNILLNNDTNIKSIKEINNGDDKKNISSRSLSHSNAHSNINNDVIINILSDNVQSCIMEKTLYLLINKLDDKGLNTNCFLIVKLKLNYTSCINNSSSIKNSKSSNNINASSITYNRYLDLNNSYEIKRISNTFYSQNNSLTKSKFNLHMSEAEDFIYLINNKSMIWMFSSDLQSHKIIAFDYPIYSISSLPYLTLRFDYLPNLVDDHFIVYSGDSLDNIIPIDVNYYYKTCLKPYNELRLKDLKCLKHYDNRDSWYNDIVSTNVVKFNTIKTCSFFNIVNHTIKEFDLGDIE